MATLNTPHPARRAPGGPTIHRVTPAIGAVLGDVDLSRPLGPNEHRAIVDAVIEHQVVFVRDQHLTAEALETLAGRFGTVSTHPVDRLAGVDKRISTIRDTVDQPPAAFEWHTDLSWTGEPPSWGFLHAVEIPPAGGDTLWASSSAVYDRLDPEMRRRCDRLRLVHEVSPDLVESVRRHRGDVIADRLLGENPPVAHPLVRVHPVSGRRGVWLSPLYAHHLEGLSADESDALLAILHAAVREPEVQVRWRWHTGDVAIWDERSTCHRALGDHYPQPRAMRRCTIDGDRPVGTEAETAAA